MLLVVERRQSRRLPGAVRSERQRAIKQRKRRLRSLLLSTAGARFPTLAADRFNPTQSRCWERTCTCVPAAMHTLQRVWSGRSACRELHLCTWSQREESSAAT